MLKETECNAVSVNEKDESLQKNAAFSFAYEANPLAGNGQQGGKIYLAYAYNWTERRFCGKIGQTSETFAEGRVYRMSGAARVGFIILGVWDAIRPDGSRITDHKIRKIVEQMGYPRLQEGENPITGELLPLPEGMKRTFTEWVNLKDAVSGLDEEKIKEKMFLIVNDAVEKAMSNLDGFQRTPLVLLPHQNMLIDGIIKRIKWVEFHFPSLAPKLLLNAVMRSGKTIVFLCAALRLGCKHILVMTHKPSVRKSIQDDLAKFEEFKDCIFIANPENPSDPDIREQYEAADKNRPIVCFASYQDILGTGLDGNIKDKNRWLHEAVWDIMGIDECHFGAGTSKSKNVVEATSRKGLQQNEIESSCIIRPQDMPIKAKRYVYMSGTPFDAVRSGEFEKEDILSWTYRNEQWAKMIDWGGKGYYANAPEMRTIVLDLPKNLLELIAKNDGCCFDLDALFAARGRGKNAKFVNEAAVMQLLDSLFGTSGNAEEIVYRLQNGAGAMQLFNRPDLDICRHSIFFLGTVASCDAMCNALNRNIVRWHLQKYRIINCSGPKAGIGAAAIPPIERAIGNHPVETNSITVTCGKGMTGTTIPGWDTIFMMLNLNSASTYLQSEMRTRTSYVEKDSNGNAVYRKRCGWVVDFDQNRVLRMLSEISYAEDFKREETPQERLIDYTNFWHLYVMEGCRPVEISDARRYDLISEMLESATQIQRFFNSGFASDFSGGILKAVCENEHLMNILKTIQKIRPDTQEDENLKRIVLTLNSQITPARRIASGRSAASNDNALYRLVVDSINNICSRVRTLLYVQPTIGSIAAIDDLLKVEDKDVFIDAIGITQEDFAYLLSCGVINRIKMNEGIQRFNWYLEKISQKISSESEAA